MTYEIPERLTVFSVFLFLDFAAWQSKPLVWSNQDHTIQVPLSEGMVFCHAVHEYFKEQWQNKANTLSIFCKSKAF